MLSRKHCIVIKNTLHCYQEHIALLLRTHCIENPMKVPHEHFLYLTQLQLCTSYHIFDIIDVFNSNIVVNVQGSSKWRRCAHFQARDKKYDKLPHSELFF